MTKIRVHDIRIKLRNVGSRLFSKHVPQLSRETVKPLFENSHSDFGHWEDNHRDGLFSFKAQYCCRHAVLAILANIVQIPIMSLFQNLSLYRSRIRLSSCSSRHSNIVQVHIIHRPTMPFCQRIPLCCPPVPPLLSFYSSVILTVPSPSHAHPVSPHRLAASPSRNMRLSNHEPGNTVRLS